MFTRRAFLRLAASTPALLSGACGDDETRYGPEDAARLEAQRREERARAGRGPYGPQRYRGYRGLAALPWFELDAQGRLRCTDADVPRALDIHAHLGMSLLFAPDLDLQARSPRVRHLLDCDGEDPGCPLDLDVYINANFRPEDLRALHWQSAAQLLWGSAAAATHTVPNLLDEMDACRIERALVLPITFGLPFGDDLSERFGAAIAESEAASGRLIPAASVHPRDPERVAKLQRYAAAGARAVKLHPTMQRFYPDAPEATAVYEACARLGLTVFFHGGRAGIEPESTHRYALMRHYEGAFRHHPEVRFVLGHAGARDVAAAIPLARRYSNVWLDIHGQGVSQLHEILELLGPDRLLFGTDWPFYHQAATLAKVLLVTRNRPEARHAILRGNAERLLAG